MAKVGLYSERAAQKFGTVWWKTPDGREIEVTSVALPNDIESYKWADVVNLGPVSKYLKQGRAGALELGGINQFSHLRRR